MSEYRSWATSDGSRSTMRANRRRDTAPELAVRRLLHGRGLRYRVDFQPVDTVRSRADIVFTRAKQAVFIDGCFWHSCPMHATSPKLSSEYWSSKLQGNVERDRRTDAALIAAGWRVSRFWEHESPAEVADAIARLLDDEVARDTAGGER